MTTYGWEPIFASDYIELSWNYSDAVIHPKYGIPVDFRLWFSPYTQDFDSFSFNITLGIRA
jgi:hypothetical protein